MKLRDCFSDVDKKWLDENLPALAKPFFTSDGDAIIAKITKCNQLRESHELVLMQIDKRRRNGVEGLMFSFSRLTTKGWENTENAACGQEATAVLERSRKTGRVPLALSFSGSIADEVGAPDDEFVSMSFHSLKLLRTN